MIQPTGNEDPYLFFLKLFYHNTAQCNNIIHYIIAVLGNNSKI